jgi:glycosyltransferase involved in cell wall biosynthesis
MAQSVPKEQIIVVDGESSDRSAEIASELGCVVVSDEGKGFTFARKLGTNLVTTKFTLVLGPDDLIDVGVISQLRMHLDANPGCAGVQPSKRVEINDPTFFDRGMSLYYSRVPIGIVPVIGTPSLFRTKLMQSQSYDENLENDDTDWCFRISDLGYYFVRLGGVSSNETTSVSWGAFVQRWNWYGRGDYDFIVKHWNLNRRRALRHLFHPAKEYILRLAGFELIKLNLPGALYFALCGFFRYQGMLQSQRKGGLRSNR